MDKLTFLHKSFFGILLFFCTSTAYSQSLNSNWKHDLNTKLQAFKACDNTTVTGINPCNWYVGDALTTVYKINDFYSKEQGRHMLVSEISEFLKDSKQWTLLGRAYEQKALDEAQKYANASKAVVAIYLNEEGLGTLSLILPGELKPSGTWELKVPNSASFLTSEPGKSYVDERLSYAFVRSQMIKILLYVRK